MFSFNLFLSYIVTILFSTKRLSLISCRRPFIPAGSQRRETPHSAESGSGLCRRRSYLRSGDRPGAAGEDKVRERTGHRCQHGKYIVGPPAQQSVSGGGDSLSCMNYTDEGAPHSGKLLSWINLIGIFD